MIDGNDDDDDIRMEMDNEASEETIPVITYNRGAWDTSHVKPYKQSGMDGMFRTLL